MTYDLILGGSGPNSVKVLLQILLKKLLSEPTDMNNDVSRQDEVSHFSIAHRTQQMKYVKSIKYIQDWFVGLSCLPQCYPSTESMKVNHICIIMKFMSQSSFRDMMLFMSQSSWILRSGRMWVFFTFSIHKVLECFKNVWIQECFWSSLVKTHDFLL